MKAGRVVLLTLLALLCVVLVADFRGSIALTQQRYPGRLSSEQRRALELTISTNATPSGFFSSGQVPEKQRFKSGEHVDVGIVMTNKGAEPLRVCAFSNPYYQNRPELVRDGKPVAYSERVAELVRQSDSGLCEFTRVPDVVDLKPNVPLRVPSLELQEWYGPLEQGQYRLVIKRTFACCADGTLKASNEISFKVTH